VAKGHELTPVHVTVFVLPRAVTPPGHAEAPVHVTLQSPAEHATPPVHELEPHVTVHVDPAHATAPHAAAAVQSIAHELDDVQSMLAPAPSPTRTEHGTPAGHAHAPDTAEHVTKHVPPSHEPPAQPAAQLASPPEGRASEPASGWARTDASEPSVASLPP
jgi:hypothetical protein